MLANGRGSYKAARRSPDVIYGAGEKYCIVVTPQG